MYRHASNLTEEINNLTLAKEAEKETAVREIREHSDGLIHKINLELSSAIQLHATELEELRTKQKNELNELIANSKSELLSAESR